MNTALTSFLSVARLIGLATPTATQTTQVYAGNVAKYPVSLTLTVSGNLAHGTLIYTRSGIPIRVVGTLNGTSLLLHEFDTKGTITGLYSGVQTALGYAGTWYSPSIPNKEMPFTLLTDAPGSAPKPVRLGNLTGTYAYSFGRKAGYATLFVQQTEPGKLIVAMQAAASESARTMLVVDRAVLRLTGNQATYSGFEINNRTIRLTFFDGGACVHYVGGPEAADVGQATVSGNFIRTDTKPPLFPQLN